MHTTPKLLLTLSGTLCAALYAGHIFSGTPDIPVCPDNASCFTTASDHAMTDPEGLANWAAETDPTPPSTLMPCTAYITIFEDTTWIGDALTDANAKVISTDWSSTKEMPHRGFTPFVPGCTTVNVTLHPLD